MITMTCQLFPYDFDRLISWVGIQERFFNFVSRRVDPQKGGFSCPVLISLTQGSEMFLVSSNPWFLASSHPWFIRTLVLLGGLLVNSNGPAMVAFWRDFPSMSQVCSIALQSPKVGKYLPVSGYCYGIENIEYPAKHQLFSRVFTIFHYIL